MTLQDKFTTFKGSMTLQDKFRAACVFYFCFFSLCYLHHWFLKGSVRDDKFIGSSTALLLCKWTVATPIAIGDFKTQRW
jgi:hypothetical protein